MADQDYEVGARLTWDSDTSKLKESQGLVSDLGNSLDELATKATGALAAFAGFAAIASFIKKGAEEAIKLEDSIAALRSMMMSLGGDEGTAVEQTRALAEKLAGAGVSAVQTTDAVTKLAMITGGNYLDALAGAELATRVSIGLHVDFSRALMLVQYAMEGSPRAVTVALRQFGIHAKNAQDVLDQLYNRTKDISPALETTGAQLRAVNEQLAEFGRTLGTIYNTVKVAFVSAFEYMAFAVEAVIISIRQFGARTIDVMNLVKNAVSKGPKQAWADFQEDSKKTTQSFNAEWDEAAKKLRETWAGIEVDAGKAGARAFTQYVGYGDEMVEEWKKLQEKKAKDDEEREKHRIEMLDKGASEQIRLAKEVEAQEEKYLLERQEASDRFDRERGEADTRAVNEYLSRQEKVDKIGRELADKHKKLNAEELANKVVELNAILEATRNTDLKIMGLNQAAADAEEKLDAAVAKAKLDKDLDYVSQATEIAAALFGKNKSAALAEATIGTAVAAVHGFETIPFIPAGLLAGALALAKGIAQIETIESTNIGGGGRGGTSGGGSMSMPSIYGQPARGGQTPSSVSTTSISTSAPTVINNNIQALDTNNALRTLQTNFRPASRNYDRSIGTRTPTSIGSKRGA